MALLFTIINFNTFLHIATLMLLYLASKSGDVLLQLSSYSRT